MINHFTTDIELGLNIRNLIASTSPAEAKPLHFSKVVYTPVMGIYRG